MFNFIPRWNYQLAGRLFVAFVGVLHSFALTAYSEEVPKLSASVKMPLYRVDTNEFNASEKDIRAVCDSAGRELWRHFHEYPLEPFVVTRGRQGPIVLFQRNSQKEIVIRLDTSDAYWAQYSYQFAPTGPILSRGIEERAMLTGRSIHINSRTSFAMCCVGFARGIRATAGSRKRCVKWRHYM